MNATSAIFAFQASNPEKERRHGRCPLTPEEVGLMLKALGYTNDVHIYVASGDIYGGAKTLAPLKTLFPNLHTKRKLQETTTFGARVSKTTMLLIFF